jgi:predicted  nucleic acid-binding Zn-ribbon protein
MREQERAHWGCAFFRHCWNEGLKLPTLRNCPECSDRYFEYRQETVNRRSVHERIGRIHPSDDRCQKIIEFIDHPRKRQADQRWADQEEDEHEYIWQEGQWCPPGLRKSQKRRVQRLKNRELRQAGIQKKQVWRPKDKPEGSGRSAPACMVYFFPNEFMAPANQVVQGETSLDVNDDEHLRGLMAQLVLAKQATFDKPAKNRHMRPLYLKGYVNGKPLTKMFVDGGAAVNVMPYTTFTKLGMGPGDLTPTSIILNNFAGNPSDTKGVRPCGPDD